MDFSLLTSCKNFQMQEEEFFHRATLQHLQGSQLENDEKKKLFAFLLQQKISSVPHYLNFLKKTISWIFLSKEDPSLFREISLQDLIRKICQKGYFHHAPFTTTLQELIFFFLQKPVEFSSPKILSQGAILLEPLSLGNGEHLPDLERGALISLLWLLLGKESEKSHFSEAAYLQARWCLNMLDTDYFPFVGLWKEEFYFKEKDLLCSLFLMFDLIGSYFAQDQMKRAAKALQEKLSLMHEDLSMGFFYALLANEIQKEEKNLSLPFVAEAEEEKIWFDPDLLCVRYWGKDFSSAFTITGSRSTLGALHLGDVQIRAFGPQWFPIGDPLRFGIVRSPFANAHFSSVEWKQKEMEYTFRGVSALSPLNDEEGSYWMDVKQAIENHRFLLDLSFHGECKERLVFVFYVLAQRCRIEGKLDLLKGTMQRYEGAPRKVFLQGKKASLQIRSQNSFCLHVIPLGGRGAFWGTNFLVAYEMAPENPSACFVIEKDKPVINGG